MTGRALTRAQNTKIWGAAREIGLDEADLRDIVEQTSGSRSISGLTFADAILVIDRLVELGARRGRRPSGRRKSRNEVQLITPRQRSLIDQLRTEVGGGFERDPYFAGACRKVIGRDVPRTAAEAARVIEMLKARRAHDRRRAT